MQYFSEMKDSDSSPWSEREDVTTFDYDEIKGQPVPIKWEGKLNRDATEITEGKFSFLLGTGTFTAAKSTGEKK